MKLNLNVLFVCLTIVLLSACEKEEPIEPRPPQPREKVSRTVLAYIVGDNTSNDLSALLMDDFREMKAGMALVDDADCNLVVYSEMRNDVPHLIRLHKQNGKVIADTLFTYPERNPVSKAVMADVITETVRLFPADSYGLVYLSHGDGWAPAISPQSRSIGDYRGTQMNISDFHQVLKSTQIHLDYILFDDCFMQSVEVAYELRDCVDYFIGSPTEIPGPGAPYGEVVRSLFEKENVAKGIADSYFNYYNDRYTGKIPSSNANWTGGVSVSVISSQALESLAFATQEILSKYISYQQPIDVSSILSYDKRNSNYRYYYDLDGLVNSLTHKNADYDVWKQAFDAAVIQWSTTPMNYSFFINNLFSMEASAGLATYIPRAYSAQLNTFYRTYEWYTAAGWDQVGW